MRDRSVHGEVPFRMRAGRTKEVFITGINIPYKDCIALLPAEIPCKNKHRRMGISHPNIVSACIPQGESQLDSRCGRGLDILLRENGHTLPFCFLFDSINQWHTEQSRAT